MRVSLKGHSCKIGVRLKDRGQGSQQALSPAGWRAVPSLSAMVDQPVS